VRKWSTKASLAHGFIAGLLKNNRHFGIILLLNMFVVRCQTATYAFTQATTGISSNTATLRGIATPNGVPSLAWFDWGTDSDYGEHTSPQDVASGGKIVPVKTGISGLIPGGIYHYRLVVSNAVGVVYGADQRFTTGTRVAAWGDNS